VLACWGGQRMHIEAGQGREEQGMHGRAGQGSI
jgi:hypothetical protein